ncbi:MAG: NADH-quinone oxidoreductase subunit C [Campylobacterota bacterium]|nr:NADH-quinone oxidoreductase subunit C [Campylobacterota bacterium]
MQKIKISLEEIKEKIKDFYDEKLWHFITLNGVALADEKTEIQWIFSKYESLDDVVIYYVEIAQDAVVPSVVDIIPSAIISQREIVDMFGIEIEDSSKGLYLDEDSLQMPLSSCGVKI